MTKTARPIAEDDLQAYVDGQLAAARAAEVEAYLAEHPEDAARIAAYKSQNAALHAVYDPILDEPVPPAMRAGRGPAWIRPAAGLAAAIALFVLGIAGGWWLRGPDEVAQAPTAIPLAERAMLAHSVYVPEVRHPVEVAADQEAHLVKWLSKRLGSEVRAPRLAEAGFALVGGRLLPDSPSPAAQFMYEDAKGRRVTLYLRTEVEGNRTTAFHWFRQGDVSVCYWIDRSIGYALAGPMEKDELWRLAELVYDQLDG